MAILQLYYVFGLCAAVALNDVELNALAFVQRFESVASDCAEMYEYVISAFNLDETKSFVCVKPFNCTLLHTNTSIFLYMISYSVQLKLVTAH